MNRPTPKTDASLKQAIWRHPNDLEGALVDVANDARDLERELAARSDLEAALDEIINDCGCICSYFTKHHGLCSVCRAKELLAKLGKQYDQT